MKIRSWARIRDKASRSRGPSGHFPADGGSRLRFRMDRQRPPRSRRHPRPGRGSSARSVMDEEDTGSSRTSSKSSSTAFRAIVNEPSRVPVQVVTARAFRVALETRWPRARRRSSTSATGTPGPASKLPQRRDHVHPHRPEGGEEAAEEAHGEGHGEGDSQDEGAEAEVDADLGEGVDVVGSEGQEVREGAWRAGRRGPPSEQRRTDSPRNETRIAPLGRSRGPAWSRSRGSGS